MRRTRIRGDFTGCSCTFQYFSRVKRVLSSKNSFNVVCSLEILCEIRVQLQAARRKKSAAELDENWVAEFRAKF